MTFNIELVDVYIGDIYFEEIEATIEFDHDPATTGDRDEYGAPLEPDTPETVNILSVVVDMNGIGEDVKDSITKDIDYIERLAMEHVAGLSEEDL